jgi:PAS domain S-box-containing protein
MITHKNRLISSETKAWLDILEEGIYLVDKEKTIVFWNKGAEKITGFKPKEMIGRHYEEFSLVFQDTNISPFLTDDTRPENSVIDKIMDVRLYARHKNGNNVPIVINISPFRNDKGEILGTVHIFKDISAEEKIRQQEGKFRKVVRQYVSETTYKEILKTVNRENYKVTGHNRDLTILFTDIVGFTTLSEKLAPEKVVEMLNAYFSLTSLIIQKNNGDIDKFLGDGVMAIFKKAEEAVQASIDMIRLGLKKLNTTLRSSGLPEINVRIGINSGDLIQGNIGNEERKDWTVVGDVVNTAFRIEEAADPGSIRIAEDTINRLKNPEQYTFVKEMTPKGKSTAIRLYKPAGMP